MSSSALPRQPNRLIHETSPYLLQHAYNPVDWYPWGPEALQAAATRNQGQGGWPMTVFLTPEQQPFFAGTYFPPEGRWGRPGFPDLLKQIADIWSRDTNGLRQQAQELTVRLRRDWQTPAPVTVTEQ